MPMLKSREDLSKEVQSLKKEVEVLKEKLQRMNLHFANHDDEQRIHDYLEEKKQGKLLSHKQVTGRD
ncbi:MAG TPA: hypothetical protein VJA40_06150 [archaeon]|nr:hypothetical protein [archaeon]